MGSVEQCNHLADCVVYVMEHCTHGPQTLVKMKLGEAKSIDFIEIKTKGRMDKRQDINRIPHPFVSCLDPSVYVT